MTSPATIIADLQADISTLEQEARQMRARMNRLESAISPDCNVESLRERLLQRSVVGLQKYGVTTERTDLSRIEWLRHAQEEALDMAVYLEKLIAIERGEQT